MLTQITKFDFPFTKTLFVTLFVLHIDSQVFILQMVSASLIVYRFDTNGTITPINVLAGTGLSDLTPSMLGSSILDAEGFYYTCTYEGVYFLMHNYNDDRSFLGENPPTAINTAMRTYFPGSQIMGEVYVTHVGPAGDDRIVPFDLDACLGGLEMSFTGYMFEIGLRE
jgi:hypothetical protein